MKKYVIFIFFVHVFVSSAQWVPQNSGTTTDLTHIFFLNNDTGFVSTASGGMRKTTNGGVNWTFINTGGVFVFDFYFFSVDTGVCLSDSGIYCTVNGGTQWNAVVIEPFNPWTQNLFCFNRNDLFTVAPHPDSLIIYKSTDKGNTWIRHAYNLPSAFDSYMFFTSIDTGYISTAGIIYKTTDGGNVWTNIYNDPNGFISNYFVSHAVGFLLDYYGGIFKTTNGGYNWNQVNTDGNTDLKRSIIFTTNSIGYTVGGNGFSPGFVLKTTNTGDDWYLDYASSHTLEDIYFPNLNVGYACGWGGTIIKYVGDVSTNDQEIIQDSLITYPNPTSGKLTFQISTLNLIKSTVAIFNSLGEVILEFEIRAPKTEIDLSSQPPGVYIVKIMGENKNIINKFLKL